jgi:hypothetical protein
MSSSTLWQNLKIEKQSYSFRNLKLMQSNEISIENFPTTEALKTSLYKKNINRALNIVHKKFEQIDLSNPSVLLLKTDFHVPASEINAIAYTISDTILHEVMKFLSEKGYRINEIQDSNNNYIGWKIYI